MSKTIEDLRAVLFDALEGVKSGTLSVEKAKCISELSQVMVNSARVEVENAKVTGKKSGAFLEPKQELPNGITGTTIHKIR
ncbi:hypothetical protein [Herbaspirillum sp. ST 5-3]|uniref:hypothetical protein n=1 Tax=Oxalobacteraceae TaxID=75682 RepID=UPI0010A2D9B1|nr:hypothetical protein [Herbaspirillum sp. ST 5-3]